MSRAIACCIVLLVAAVPARSEEPPAKPAGDKVMSGMSVVGNDDAPKSLVIVPWKSSVLGDVLDVSHGLDDGRGPVDKDVFERELGYYEIRVTSGDAGETAR